jgi:hypothetical protein
LQFAGDALFVVALTVVDDVVGVGGEAGAAEVEGVVQVVGAGRLALELALAQQCLELVVEQLRPLP